VKPTNLKPVTIIVVVVITLFLGYGVFKYLGNQMAGSKGKEEIAALTKDDVRALIKDYINDHPEEILKSVDAMQRRASEETQKNAQKTIASRRADIEDIATTPFVGNPNGDVKVVQFFDYSCGYCKSAHPTIQQLLNDDKNITFIYKEFPILGPISEVAARYALAVYNLDKSKYNEFHNRLMLAHLTNEEGIIAIAQSLGIDPSKLKIEANKPEIMATITKNRELAKDIGVRGTPAFIIGGELVPGAVDLAGLKAKIDDARKKPAATAPAAAVPTATPAAAAAPADKPADASAPAAAPATDKPADAAAPVPTATPATATAPAADKTDNAATPASTSDKPATDKPDDKAPAPTSADPQKPVAE